MDVIRAWVMLVLKRSVRHGDKYVIRYGPLLVRDRERMTNMNHIYNINYVEAVNMLQMRRARFAKWRLLR